MPQLSAFGFNVPLPLCGHVPLAARQCPRRRKIRFQQITATATRPHVRVATPEDISTVSNLVATAFTEDLRLYRRVQTCFLARLFGAGALLRLYQSASQHEMALQLRRRLDGRPRRHALLLAVADAGAIVGCIEVGVVNGNVVAQGGVIEGAKQWERAPASDACVAYIGNLAVVSSARRRRVGSMLVTEAEKMAREKWNLETIWLHVDVDNEPALLLYKHLGFVCEFVEPEWIRGPARPPRMFLRRSSRKDEKWGEPRLLKPKMGPWSYLRYCWYDLSRIRKEQ